MTSLLEAVAVLALVVTGMAVTVGVMSPSEALRRIGVVLVFLTIVPCFAVSLIHGAVGPVFAALVTNLERAAHILLIVAAVALIGWLAIQATIKFHDIGHKKGEE